jgi:DNA-binding NtrC family response regulator
MFDILTEQTDTNGAFATANFGLDTSSDSVHDVSGATYAADNGQATFRSINVLIIETRGDVGSASIVEQCLRYMTGFECRIAQAGSIAAAQFALQADAFDLVMADEHCLDVVAASAVPTIVTTHRQSSETTRKALKAGALHCLPLIDLSPRLLETAVNQALSIEPAL